VNLNDAYGHGRAAALKKFALASPSPADELIASIEHAPDAPPPAAPMLPQEIPQAPPEIAAQPLPSGAPPDPSMQDSQQPPTNLGKEAALGLQQMLFLEKAMGHNDAADMFADVERQMSGQGGGRTGTMKIGPQGTEFQQRPKLPTVPAKPATPSLGTQAADSVITSAKRFAPGVRVR
jgi:hypothetical protein